MHEASAKLVDMDYLGCEALCLEALAAARGARDWSLYARVVMPLQEARRQRRMIAADAAVQLGSAEGDEPAGESVGAGCVVLTRPRSADDAQALLQTARNTGEHLEVLWADNDADAARWTLRSFEGPAVCCEVDAPPATLRNRPRQPDDALGTGVTPRHWFVSASEALGDAALAAVDAPPGTEARVDQLEAYITACGDHELLHQALADAAGALVKARA